MTKGKKQQHGQGYNILPIIKAIETAILILMAVYKAVKFVIEEIRTQRVSQHTTDLDGVDQWHLK
jgi:hypothetical protein